MTQYLQDAAHPLEAVFLRGVRPLLCHDNDPLVVQHGHRKHSYPGKGNIKTWLQRVGTECHVLCDRSGEFCFSGLLYLPLYTNFMGSTASAVATTSSALCLLPLTTISPSILPTTNTRLSWWGRQSTFCLTHGWWQSLKMCVAHFTLKIESEHKHAAFSICLIGAEKKLKSKRGL